MGQLKLRIAFGIDIVRATAAMRRARRILRDATNALVATVVSLENNRELPSFRTDFTGFIDFVAAAIESGIRVTRGAWPVACVEDDKPFGCRGPIDPRDAQGVRLDVVRDPFYERRFLECKGWDPGPSDVLDPVTLRWSVGIGCRARRDVTQAADPVARSVQDVRLDDMYGNRRPGM
jgi:hypothetical protein